MSKREELLALAERVEETTGPDRELECRIWCALGRAGFPYNEAVAVVPDLTQWLAPFYLASLDAARGLVPEGLRTTLSEWDDEQHLRSKGAWQAILSRPGQDATFDAMRGFRCDHAASPALALCAAALRARAAMETDNG